MSKPWSNLSQIVYKRTYARKNPDGTLENHSQTVDRVIAGNVRNHKVGEEEISRLRYYMTERKADSAGRGSWFSGTEAHKKLGGVALCNCWYLSLDDWTNFVIAMDLLMLGGGVGASVEHRFVSKMPKIKKGVSISHVSKNDADFIVPDSREGWCELSRRVLEAYFVTGKGFTYSTVCVRGYGVDIKGFGGTASGPIPLIKFVENLSKILGAREGKSLRPIDAMDVLCCTGEMVVAGNVRRSAIIILGDAFDKEYLLAKRWDLGTIPSYRGFANLSVVCDDVEDLHPLFWRTYEDGEPFGIINRKNIQTFARMGEKRKDTAVGMNPCAEATLESFEPCNLQEIFLPNLDSKEEFIEASRLMHRYGKRVTMEKYHIPEVQRVVERNRRVGTGITGCLQSKLFTPEILNEAYNAIQDENRTYSKELGINESIRTTVVKPSGTKSKTADVPCEGIHPVLSRYIIQRVRFATNDPLVPHLRKAGHYIEPQTKIDGSMDPTTVVVDFYVDAGPDAPANDKGFDTWKQLDTLLLAQKYWSDQAVSVTVYYRKEEIPQIKAWLAHHIQYIKSISFLCFNDHGFNQAPKEVITEEQFAKLSAKVKPLDESVIGEGDLESQECVSGACPVK